MRKSGDAAMPACRQARQYAERRSARQWRAAPRFAAARRLACAVRPPERRTNVPPLRVATRRAMSAVRLKKVVYNCRNEGR